MKKIGVLLSGCGVFDGSEIHEATLSLLAIDQQGWQAVCMAPNISQHEVVNHLDHQAQASASRNVLQEAARIARGKIQNLNQMQAKDFEALDALVLPGGFGVAKNLSHWAFLGHEGAVLDEIKNLILYFINHRKPIIALCIAPVIVAKALENNPHKPTLTVGGNVQAEQEIQKLGAQIGTLNAESLVIDTQNRIISAPCYMNEVSIQTIFAQTQAAIKALATWLN